MTRRARRLRSLGVVIAGLAMLTTCVAETTATMPGPIESPSEIERLASDATSFAEQHLEAWPDIDAFAANYSTDYRFADPTWSDFRTGRDTVISMLRAWESMTDYTIDVTAEYISADGAAFEETWPGLQPPMPLPSEPPVASGLIVYTFSDGQIAGEDIWYRTKDNVAYGIGCFAVDDCPDLQDTVDRYVSAWADRDPDAIASLYHQDAAFSDTLLGLSASRQDAIGELADTRFGSNEGLTIEVLDLYAWTDGTTAPSRSNPDAGQLVGIAIHYRATTNGTPTTQEAVTTLELGTKTDTGIEPDPEGLIYHEEVYHSPATLVGASSD
jgi:ketosteroid isomerase-like protein